MLRKVKLFEEFKQELYEGLSDVKDINKISNRVLTKVYKNARKYKYSGDIFNQHFEDLLTLLDKHFNTKDFSEVKLDKFDKYVLEYFGEFFELKLSDKYKNRMISIEFKSDSEEYLRGGVYLPTDRRININTSALQSWINGLKDMGYNPKQMLKTKDYETDWLMLLENEYIFKSTLQHELQHFIDNMKDSKFDKKEEDLELEHQRELDKIINRFKSAYSRYLQLSYEIEARFIEDINKYELDEFVNFDDFWDEVTNSGLINLEQMFDEEIEQIILDRIEDEKKGLVNVKKTTPVEFLETAIKIRKESINKYKKELEKYRKGKEKTIQKIKKMYREYWEDRENR